MNKPINQRPMQQRGLVIAGLLCAVATTFVFNTDDEVSKFKSYVSGPVAMKAVADAKKLMRKTKWESAAERLKEHATAGNPEVLYEYGRILSNGWGTPRDLDKAREKLLLAVQHDFPKRSSTAYELGKLYQKSTGPDCNRIAFEWFVKAADWGHAKAYAELGRHYARGIGVDKDLKTAQIQYKKAAELGSASALLSFAKLLAGETNQSGSSIDAAKLIADAVPLLEAEAAAGKAGSAKVLGRLYRDGTLLPPDLALAMRWLRRSALLGDTGGMHDLAQLLISTNENSTNSDEAIKWLKTAAARGDGSALTALGRLHVSSKFGLLPEEAVEYFKKGVKAGHPGSMTELAKIYFNGSLVHSNQKLALNLAERGAALGHKGAIKLLQSIENKNRKISKFHPASATGATLVISRN
ncbi:MAG: tetratricopeptide repeat protein [Hyphomicrobiales bacterium]